MIMNDEMFYKTMNKMDEDIIEIKTELKLLSESLIRLEERSIPSSEFNGLFRIVDRHKVYFAILGIVVTAIAVPMFLLCFEWILGKL